MSEEDEKKKDDGDSVLEDVLELGEAGCLGLGCLFDLLPVFLLVSLPLLW